MLKLQGCRRSWFQQLVGLLSSNRICCKTVDCSDNDFEAKGSDGSTVQFFMSQLAQGCALPRLLHELLTEVIAAGCDLQECCRG